VRANDPNTSENGTNSIQDSVPTPDDTPAPDVGWNPVVQELARADADDRQ
jgi:hypothetical protein